MTDREITTAELADDLRRIEAGVDGIHKRLDSLDARFVLQVVATEQSARRDIEIAALRASVDEIRRAGEENRRNTTWAWRTGLTGVLLPIFVAIIVAFMLHGGG